MPSADTPETYLKQAYLAELSGEVMMNCLAERVPERKSALQLLAGIEQKTAASLAASQAFTVTEAEQAEAVSYGRTVLDQFEIQDWSSLVTMMQPYARDALQMFQAAETGAPAELADVYRELTQHEQALLDFFEKEIKGDDGSSILTGYLSSAQLRAYSPICVI